MGFLGDGSRSLFSLFFFYFIFFFWSPGGVVLVVRFPRAYLCARPGIEWYSKPQGFSLGKELAPDGVEKET